MLLDNCDLSISLSAFNKHTFKDKGSCFDISLLQKQTVSTILHQNKK
ncbi:uncharacterized protein METZ01_LOCUS301565 [marine metagenome]|uniref:Uncharacterized protein n=1 Tax=marine metagenome TaxID=408172 RepID=A0A382MN17_9ZZZZ